MKRSVRKLNFSGHLLKPEYASQTACTKPALLDTFRYAFRTLHFIWIKYAILSDCCDSQAHENNTLNSSSEVARNCFLLPHCLFFLLFPYLCTKVYAYYALTYIYGYKRVAGLPETLPGNEVGL